MKLARRCNMQIPKNDLKDRLAWLAKLASAKELYKWGRKEGSMIDIQRYAGTQANVNSYLLSDADNVIVVDLLRNSPEARNWLITS
jgi:hypothetical protein